MVKLERSKSSLALSHYWDSSSSGGPGASTFLPGLDRAGEALLGSGNMASDGAAAPLGSIDNPVKFQNQDFDALLQECLKEGKLFTDPTFPAEQKSVGMPKDPNPAKEIKWKRPKEISADALFVEDTIGTTDICQGQLGDCWLLAALSALTVHSKLFAKVVPPNQSLSDSYAGIFHFRFWQYGEWVEVVVDDRLPVREGRLLFSYSRTRNEFWSALVEKAYAKLVGSYGSLKGGNISEGMEDFTGGIAYSLPVASRTPPVLWRMLTAALSRGSLLSCFIQASSYSEVGKVTADGLVKGHAYAITDTDKVARGPEEVLLLKLRNPWGFVEFCGSWSDKCKEWEDTAQSEKQRIELKLEEDGEFWISAGDFSVMFGVVELCSVSPDSLEDGDAATGQSTWTLSEHKGSWVPGSSAGGSRKYNKSFWKNPQFELVLREQDQEDEDEEEEEEENDGEEDEIDKGEEVLKEKNKAKTQKKKHCTVLVELLQKNRRQNDKINFLYVAFHVYKVPLELQGACLDRNFFMKTRPVGRSGAYKAQRGVWRKLRLDPGHYVIVGSTYRPNQPGEFFVRIFSKTRNTLEVQDFTCSSDYLPVMAAPLLPEDQTKVEKTFDEKAGPDDRLNAQEIMKLINSVFDKSCHLPLETCRQIIFGEDTEGRSTLSREQAETVLADLRTLQSVFVQFDEDSSGSISPFELSLALETIGMTCDSKVVQLLSERFVGGEPHLSFHGFVSCVSRLRKLFALFESETSPEVKDRGINSWLLQFLAL
ncbi:calpain-12 [Gambusia affinis]|uniref:calpain-12 n=1 Tax=Gambusia affinis TaxID=33528 RepID=UPI001CDD2E92|nr:calpain-12 [Gambusia affinis]XP_043976167.1 calpain-12 [Gambusia affinis]XP_043976168.1 calpain-12 [Gambusia affinis]